MDTRTLRAARRRTITALAATGLVGAALSFTLSADAAQNPGSAVHVACVASTPIGNIDTEQDVSIRLTGPDTAESGAAVTTRIVGQDTTLPSEASGQAVDSYSGIETRIDVFGATLTDATMVTAPSGPGTGGATVTTSGSTVIITIPGPIPGGSTITGATVDVTATVTAATGATTGLDPGSPFYKVTANTSSFGAVPATCDPANGDEAAKGTLTIPVAGADTAGPAITITAPYDGAIYGYQQVVSAAYSCSDPSGVASCSGTAAVGAAVDTSTQGAKSFTVDSSDTKGNTASKTVDYLVLPPGVEPPPPPTFTALNPGRLLDTRDGGTTVDGQQQGTGPATPGQTVELQVAGRHGVPDDAIAAVLNITATDTQGWGYVTVYPCGEARPNASSLNYTDAGDTRPNAVVTKLGAGGKVCIDAGEAGTQLIADVAGYFPPGAAYVSLNPGRLLDTRDGAATIDGSGAAQGAVAPGQFVQVQVAGRHDVPADAEAVVLNVTATDTQGWGYVTAYPCDATAPNASNLNFTAAGQTTPNAVVSKLAADGSVCLYVGEAGTQLIADVAGYFPAGSGYSSINPARMLDSRAGSSTIDGAGTGEQLGQGGAPLPAGATVTLPIAGRPGVPADATGAVLNVTMTDSQGWGYVTVYPCDADRPNASNLNSTQAGQTRPNAVFTKFAANGTVCLYVAEAATHLIVDVDGYFPSPEGPDVPPFDPPETPPTTTPPPTQPGETTTTTSTTAPPPGAEAPAACADYGSQLQAQAALVIYRVLGLLDPNAAAAADAIDPNGNGTACEDYPF